MDILYYIIPKTSEIGSLTTEITLGYGIDEYQPIAYHFSFFSSRSLYKYYHF